MNRGRERGFTVIETMLFLGVSGLLIIGVLIGSAGAINTQRYKDATNSLLSFFQGEYDRVANVQNIRANDVTCNSGDTSLSASPSTRGTTECVIMGRLLTPSESGDSITSRTVYASNDFSNMFSESGAQLSGDISAIQASGIFIDESLGESSVYSPEWGTRIVEAGSNNPGVWQMLIVRSPASGAVRTYISSDTGLGLDALVSSANEAERLICLDSRGLVLTGNRGVIFSANTTGASGVKMVGDGQC